MKLVSLIAFDHNGREQQIEVFEAPILAREIKDLLHGILSKVIDAIIYDSKN